MVGYVGLLRMYRIRIRRKLRSHAVSTEQNILPPFTKGLGGSCFVLNNVSKFHISCLYFLKMNTHI